jgi:hypothetical protein
MRDLSDVCTIRCHDVERVHAFYLRDTDGYDGRLARAREMVGTFTTFEQWSKQSRVGTMTDIRNGTE